MSDVATQENTLSYATAEQVLATGDLSRLTQRQRVEYVLNVCRSLGLNPATRPFRFLMLNGQVQMYATKDCTDQLRSLHKISLEVVDRSFDGDLYSVTVRAKTADGRQDEDLGAVILAKAGESRANALMRCITKAKRRVTLSICGLGFVNEDELDGMPGVRVFDADDEAPPEAGPMRSEAERLMRERQSQQAQNQVAQQPTTRQWFDQFEVECTRTRTQEEAEAILKKFPDGQPPEWMADMPNAKARFEKIRQAMIDRLWPVAADAGETLKT